MTKLLWILTMVTGALLVIYVWTAAVLFFNQSSQIFFPEKKWIATPASLELPFEDVRLTAKDGVGVSAWFIPADHPRGAALLCHGNAGNISHRLDQIRIFHSLGFSVLIFDYRNYGKSDKARITEEGTYEDAEAAWDFLTAEKRFLPSDIIIAGRSLGAAIAAYLAVRHKPAALILESPFTSLVDIASEIYPYIPIRRFLKYRYDTLSRLARIDSPVLVVHSRGDELIGVSHGRRVYEAAPEPKLLIEIEGSHNNGYALSEETYLKGLKTFLDKVPEVR